MYTLKEIAILGIQGNKIKWYGFLGQGGGAGHTGCGEKSVSKIFVVGFGVFFGLGVLFDVEVYGLGLCWVFFLFPWKSVPLIVSLKTSCTAVHLLIC